MHCGIVVKAIPLFKYIISMNKYIVTLFISTLLFLLSCHQKKYDTIDIQIENFESDSLGLRILHFIEGRQIMDTTIKTGEILKIPELPEDMYMLVLYWNRTYIPHAIFRDRSFNPSEGDNYQITKAFYVKPSESKVYRFRLDADSSQTKESIELLQLKDLMLNTSMCKTCQISESYWNLYNSFFHRKEKNVIELNHKFYDAIHNNDSTFRQKYILADSVKQHQWTDALFFKEFNNLYDRYPDNYASAFFLFYQLYTFREFEKYKPLALKLKDPATQSPYYRMVKNQYK